MNSEISDMALKKCPQQISNRLPASLIISCYQTLVLGDMGPILFVLNKRGMSKSKVLGQLKVVLEIKI